MEERSIWTQKRGTVSNNACPLGTKSGTATACLHNRLRCQWTQAFWWATVCWRPSSPQKKNGTAPTHAIFGPCLLWSNGWMDEDATWYGSRPQPRARPHCVRQGPSFSPPVNGAQHPLFSAHVYYGHSRPSQLLLSTCLTDCMFFLSLNQQCQSTEGSMATIKSASNPRLLLQYVF